METWDHIVKQLNRECGIGSIISGIEHHNLTGERLLFWLRRNDGKVMSIRPSNFAYKLVYSGNYIDEYDIDEHILGAELIHIEYGVFRYLCIRSITLKLTNGVELKFTPNGNRGYLVIE